MTGDNPHLAYRPSHDSAATEFLHHSTGKRVNTDTVIYDTLRAQYPELHVTANPRTLCDLLAFAAAGHASYTPIDHTDDSTSLKWRQYLPPARRLDGGVGALVDIVHFGKYMYKFKSHEFIVYIVEGRDGVMAYPAITMQYILSSDVRGTDDLLVAASQWGWELHDQVWVFDRGYWQKNSDLWRSVQKAEWEDVILEKEKKEAIVGDAQRFFDSRRTYEKLKVPWKRGVIFHGPPGNGKTISIKALMHTLYRRDDPVPTLYVRTLASFGGPEYALNQIFMKARQTAPCYLVFEDLDSIVSDNVRSYFLNEVDGLESNDGILMVGSTNHLEQLDPGISKRPSRFDRKIYFPDPDEGQRIQYCYYWQGKLSDNDEIDFPDELCTAIAKITDKFSFAYMQEAFVAALLAIATERHELEGEEAPAAEEALITGEATASAEVSMKGQVQEIVGNVDAKLPSVEKENVAKNESEAIGIKGRANTAEETREESYQGSNNGDQESIMSSEPPSLIDADERLSGLEQLIDISGPETPDEKEVDEAKSESNGGKDLEDLILWREIKKQVKILRDEMDAEQERVVRMQVAAERQEMGVKRTAVRLLQHGGYA
ncbi:MAG: hypothetical protein M1820_003790 [Bogoriella megaspora]|nr:MAG: hypothetical protein M1820_003790 [Bogoriella megaspora]